MNHPQTLTKLVVATLLSVLALSTGLSAAPPEGGDADKDREIRRWVRQLDSDQFAQRQEAAEKLTDLGKAAVPAIEQAALTGTGEVASRSVDILKGLAISPEEDSAQLAQSSLERLAASGNRTAGYLAERALKELREQVGPGRRGETNPLRDHMPLAGGMNRSVRISTVNGDRTIDVTEDGQRVVAKTMADGSVSVTWHLPGGKERTVKADTADQLKEQDKEAFAKLEELTQMVDIGPAGFRGPRMPGGFPLPRANLRDEFDPFARFDAEMREMREQHEQILAEMEERMRVPHFPRPDGPPDARLFRRTDPPRFPLPEGAQQADPPRALQGLPAVKNHLEQLLERLDREGDVELDALELERLEKAIQDIEKQLDAN